MRPDLQIENSIGQVHLADRVSQAPPFGVVVSGRAVDPPDEAALEGLY